MIGKSHSGGGFGGLVRYLLTGRKEEPNPDRVLWTTTRDLALDDPRDAARLMRATASLGCTDEPVQHLSISLAPGEHLSREQWEWVVDTTLRDLRLEGHQALIVAHADTAHEHIHLVVNRVHPETHRAWNRWQDRPRLMASLRRQELALSLQPTPHIENPDLVPDKLVRQFERSGEPPFLDFARTVGRPIFREASSWEELHERLAESGLYLERKGQGLVVNDDIHFVKASSVDRAASLRALESRLGAYQERRPLAHAVDLALRAETREQELAAELAPLHAAYYREQGQRARRDAMASRFDSTVQRIGRTVEIAYRNPAEVHERYLAHLRRDGDPRMAPAELGTLKGLVLRVGRHHAPVGAEGGRAFETAVQDLPRLGSEYQRSRAELSQADESLKALAHQVAQLEQRFRPQLEEYGQLDRFRAWRPQLSEAAMSLRPREQLALARHHGADALRSSAEAAPEIPLSRLDAREAWLQGLDPALNRVLDRQLARHGLRPPKSWEDTGEWLSVALGQGLRPAHAVQALVRAGVSAVEVAQAASRTLSLTRAAIRHPVRIAIPLAARALGVPSLPLRIATLAYSLARGLGQQLSR